MAVDTRAKRFSMLALGTLLAGIITVDASVETEDRVTFLGLYNGFSLDSPAEAIVGAAQSGIPVAYLYQMAQGMMG